MDFSISSTGVAELGVDEVCGWVTPYIEVLMAELDGDFIRETDCAVTLCRSLGEVSKAGVCPRQLALHSVCDCGDVIEGGFLGEYKISACAEGAATTRVADSSEVVEEGGRLDLHRLLG